MININKKACTIDVTAVQKLRNEQAPLYMRYKGQFRPQPAFIALDENGNVSAGYNGDPGGAVPMDVWHGRTLRWSVPAAVKGAALADFVDRPDVRALLERVHQGHILEWDGAKTVGRLTQDARDATDELQSLCCDLDIERWQVWHPCEWLANASLGDIWPEDISLEKAVKGIIDEAEKNNVLLDGDIYEAVLEKTLKTFKSKPEMLGSVHVETLLNEKMISREEYDEWILMQTN